jgi:hypothetical protein
MEVVTPELLEEFKERMHITHDEDDNLIRLLSFSIADIKFKCGPFEIEKNDIARELVLERTRYTYNDALEYFNSNFLSQINSLAMSIAFEEGEADATI